MQSGFMYLAAVIDWYSRYVLAWTLSNSLDILFCIDALKQALTKGTPNIFNTDQGAQCNPEAFTQVLLEKKTLAISMDGRVRALDNAFIDRLWWTVRYEDIYPKCCSDGHELYHGLSRFFHYYNKENSQHWKNELLLKYFPLWRCFKIPTRFARHK